MLKQINMPIYHKMTSFRDIYGVCTYIYVSYTSQQHQPYYKDHCIHTLNSAYNEVAFNEKSAITKENLHTKYTYSHISTSSLMKAAYNEAKSPHIFFRYRRSWVYFANYFVIYIYCWTNMAHVFGSIGHTFFILYWHIYPIVQQICAKTKLTSTSASDMSIHVSERNMCAKLYVYATFHGHISGTYVHICATYEVTGINHMIRNTVQRQQWWSQLH